MERSKLVQRTTEYLLSLPDESNLTMREAVLSACPEAEEDINDRALFDLLDEISDSVRKTGAVLDFTAHDGLVEGLPFNLDFIVRKKRLQKAQLISDLLCYGPCPEPEDAIEQRITISATGKVWFTEYLLGEIGCEKKPVGRKLQIFIGKEKTMAILSKIANYLEEEPMLIRCTDIGDWTLIATDASGNEQQMSCSLCGGVVAGGVDLTDFIREQIPIEDLALFGGGSDEEDI